MSDEEQVPARPEVVPDEEADASLDPEVEFGEQDEVAQLDEWEEDVREGGS